VKTNGDQSQNTAGGLPAKAALLGNPTVAQLVWTSCVAAGLVALLFYHAIRSQHGQIPAGEQEETTVASASQAPTP
jgi:hypothetical protein